MKRTVSGILIVMLALLVAGTVFGKAEAEAEAAADDEIHIGLVVKNLVTHPATKH